MEVTMKHVIVIGPTTAIRYPALDTGETWNGNPVVAFRARDLAHLIENGDGADSNGEGMRGPHVPVDVTDGEARVVPTILAEVGGDMLALLVPEGRAWDLAPIDETPNSTVRGVSARVWFDAEDRCCACGAHLSEPHDPACVDAAAAGLREDVDANDEAHAVTLAAGGYNTSGACSSVTEGDEPVEVAHRQEPLTMKVRITLTVEIDPEAWTLNDGVVGPTDIRADVRAYIADLTTEQLRTVGILAT
jgi:hypothetical protein